MSCFESFWRFLNVILDCSGFSAAPAHIKLAEIIIIIQTLRLFVRDGILSVADYNSTRVGVVVVVVVVVSTFLQWDNLRTL